MKTKVLRLKQGIPLLVYLTVAFALGVVVVPMAMGQVASNFSTLASQEAGDGNTAGTILNPEGKGDVLLFPYYDVRSFNGKANAFYFFIINDSNLNTLLATPTNGTGAWQRSPVSESSLRAWKFSG